MLLPIGHRMVTEKQRIEGMASMRQHSAPDSVLRWSMNGSQKEDKERLTMAIMMIIMMEM